MIVPLDILIEIIIATDVKTQVNCYRLCKSVRKHIVKHALPLYKNFWAAKMAPILKEISSIELTVRTTMTCINSSTEIHCDGVRVQRIGDATKTVTAKATSVYMSKIRANSGSRLTLEFSTTAKMFLPDGAHVCKHPRCGFFEGLDGVAIRYDAFKRCPLHKRLTGPI